MPKIREMKVHQLRKLIKEATKMIEDRRDDLEYDTVHKTKGRGKKKTVTDEIDFLAVQLKGHESAQLTRLAEKYFEAKEAFEKAKIEKDSLNEELKDLSAPLWDVKDQVHQRLVTTVSYGFSLDAMKDSKKVDWEGIVNDLVEALDIQQELLNEIVEKNTKIKKSTKETLREPGQKLKTWMAKKGAGKRQIEESLSFSELKATLQDWFQKFRDVANRYLGVIDNKLAEIDRKLS